MQKRGRKSVGLAAPLNESKGCTRATNAALHYHSSAPAPNQFPPLGPVSQSCPAPLPDLWHTLPVPSLREDTVANRSRSTFQKRQKEMKRQEKQRQKAERRAERSQARRALREARDAPAKSAAPGELTAPAGHPEADSR